MPNRRLPGPPNSSATGRRRATQAWLEIDLDARLQFASGLVLVTNRRLLARAPGTRQWQEWPLRAGLALNHHDHAGVSALELVDAPTAAQLLALHLAQF